MQCPKCGHEQPDGNIECSACGVIFAKCRVLSDAQGADPSLQPVQDGPEDGGEEADGGFIGLLRSQFLHVEDTVNPFYFGGRVLVYILILAWGWKFILTPMNAMVLSCSFMHLINLPFHEAGHIIFSPFGEFMHMFGGTLGQLLMPAICMAALLFFQRDAFGASVALWWLGQSFLDIAPYIDDARRLELVLLGGVTGRDFPESHDWLNILAPHGWLKYDHAIAGFASKLGVVLMLMSFLWGGYLLILQYRNIEKI